MAGGWEHTLAMRPALATLVAMVGETLSTRGLWAERDVEGRVVWVLGEVEAAALRKWKGKVGGLERGLVGASLLEMGGGCKWE